MRRGNKMDVKMERKKRLKVGIWSILIVFEREVFGE